MVLQSPVLHFEGWASSVARLAERRVVGREACSLFVLADVPGFKAEASD